MRKSASPLEALVFLSPESQIGQGWLSQMLSWEVQNSQNTLSH